MMIRELSMGEKQAILKLREKKRKLIEVIAQALGIANTTIWNVLEKKETITVLTARHQTLQPKYTTVVNCELWSNISQWHRQHFSWGRGGDLAIHCLKGQKY